MLIRGMFVIVNKDTEHATVLFKTRALGEVEEDENEDEEAEVRGLGRGWRQLSGRLE
jgi:hypothetical protein